LTALNVQHKITTADILHHEINSGLGLETGVQVQQEWVAFLVGNQENTLFRLGALNFIVLNDELLLQNLNGI
jgi:hypothetical protein